MKRNVIEQIKEYRPFEQLLLLTSRYKLTDEERDYIVELTQRADLNWYEFLGAAMINRVNGVVFNNMKDMRMPQYVRYFLELAYHEQKERTAIHQAELLHISELLEKENVRYTLLKGAVLNTLFYEAGQRISNDTDMMVDVNDLDKAVIILKNDGYIQGEVHRGELVPATKKEILFKRLNTYEIVPLNKPMNNRYLPYHEIDINFRLGNDDIQGSAETMMEDTVCLSNNGHSIRTLPLEKFLLFLCVHHYREATMVMKIVNGEDLTLYKFMDIHFFVTQKYDEIDWDYLYKLAGQLNRMNDVYYTFYYSEMLYPGTFDVETLDRFKPADTAFLNQYRGRDNSAEVYTWETSFTKRAFSYERKIEALKNIEEEDTRFRKIQEQLRQ